MSWVKPFFAALAAIENGQRLMEEAFKSFSRNHILRLTYGFLDFPKVRVEITASSLNQLKALKKPTPSPPKLSGLKRQARSSSPPAAPAVGPS